MSRRAWLTEALFYGACLVMSCYLAQLRFALNVLDRATVAEQLERLMRGEGPTPYQYRCLVPLVARALRAALDAADVHVSTLHLFELLEWASVLALAAALRCYLGCFFRDRRATAVLAFGVYYVYPFCYLLPRVVPHYQPCDTAAVAFFAVGLALLYRGRTAAYYALFAAATLNRETTCFLTVIFLLTRVQRGRLRAPLLHGGAQLLIWAGIKAALWRVYGANPGPGMSCSMWTVNIHDLAAARYWPTLAGAAGMIWLPALLFGRRVPDRFVRRALWVVLPYLAGMFFVGYLFEPRIYGELIPVLLPACYLLAREAPTWGGDGRPAPHGGRSPDPSDTSQQPSRP